MKQLIFCANYMLSDKWQEKSKLPLDFISFAFIEGKMYRIDKEYITIPFLGDKRKKWGQDRVYGAIFALDKSEYYMRVLDGIMGNSKSVLHKNHDLDYNWRYKLKVTPIHFDTITQFSKLLYIEKDPVECIAYLGNMNNILIKSKINNTYRNRIIDGYDEQHFIDALCKYKKL